MSLKRLLNPDSEDAYSNHQPHQTWTDSGLSIEAVPIIQEQSWQGAFAELLGSQSLQDDFSQSFNGDYDNEETTQSFVQGQIDQWANANVTADEQNSSAVPTLEEDTTQICYGMIYRASVKLRGNMADLDSKLSSGGGYPVPGHYQMSIVRSDEQFIVTFTDNTALGDVNAQLEKALTSITEQHHQIELEVFAPIKPIRETINRATKEKVAIVRVNVNVYGSRAICQAIGRELSAHKVYLQRPDYIRTGLTYENPHVLKLANFQSSFVNPPVQMEEERQPNPDKTESFKKTISEVYSNLTRGQRLIGLEGDGRLKTSLLLHQKQALDFMSQRESGPIPEEFRLWKPTQLDGRICYRHCITGNISRIEHAETGGGILADEMGMGKTLSILALLLRTLEAAHGWAAEPNIMLEQHSNLKVRHRTRATLIVASSDLMINEWLQEIERHFHRQVAGALRIIKYHGLDREMQVSKLRDADLIITTYHTLASDFARGTNPLNDIEWYRLVLDEAHIVRRQSTGLYRTVAELKARSRWCLTGTPIQNRLEDIGSLFAFIRVNPFNSLSVFRKYIAMPFDEGGKRRTMAIERFIRLLDSICLRRTKDLLHLPDQRDRVRNIEFSPEERTQYDQTKKMMFRAVRNQGAVFDHKTTLGMFQVQLQLRILCNHGTYQQPFSWNRRKLHLLDEREDKEAQMGRDGEVTCSACKQTMPLFESGSMFQRYTEHCRHVVCAECLEESMSKNSDSLPKSCPLCSSLWATPSQTQRPIHSSEDDTYFRAQGRSSKMEALMKDVYTDLCTTKSIIFSCWTRTLDLIQFYLRSASITFRRIDGECPTAKREKILEDFAKNPHLRVLIMTTGTGAVGLNLATANRVFIVEPQWNPSVENQAIARALRLGQEQSVQVTRYVVNKTVEQEMRSLQDRKLEIAGIAWE